MGETPEPYPGWEGDVPRLFICLWVLFCFTQQGGEGGSPRLSSLSPDLGFFLTAGISGSESKQGEG